MWNKNWLIFSESAFFLYGINLIWNFECPYQERILLSTLNMNVQVCGYFRNFMILAIYLQKKPLVKFTTNYILRSQLFMNDLSCLKPYSSPGHCIPLHKRLIQYMDGQLLKESGSRVKRVVISVVTNAFVSVVWCYWKHSFERNKRLQVLMWTVISKSFHRKWCYRVLKMNDPEKTKTNQKIRF